MAPGPIRVEVPPTLEHWEAAFVAPHVSLARGWERQLDIANNDLFYVTGALTPASYQAWLDTNGVTWVALPTAPLDYAAQAEARLLDSGQVPGLRLAWVTPQWQLWQVEGSPGLVSGPARLTSLVPDHLTLQVSPAGTDHGAGALHDVLVGDVRGGVPGAGAGGWTSVDGRVGRDGGVVGLDDPLHLAGGVPAPQVGRRPLRPAESPADYGFGDARPRRTRTGRPTPRCSARPSAPTWPRTAARLPDHEALVDCPSGRRWTYAELRGVGRVRWRVACWLRG